jgi:phage gpG-like protein
MPVALSISVEGVEAVHQRLERLNIRSHPGLVIRALDKCAELTQEIAATKKIIRGGKGPPHPHKLTSRTGTLRRSIAVSRRHLPWAIDIGTDLVYGAVHEEGGTVNVGSYSRAIGSSTRSGGASMALVRSHTRTYPKRAYLVPALEEAANHFDDIFAREIEKELA